MEPYNRPHIAPGAAHRRVSYASVAAGAADAASQSSLPPPGRTVSYSPSTASSPDYPDQVPITRRPSGSYWPTSREPTTARSSLPLASTPMGYGSSFPAAGYGNGAVTAEASIPPLVIPSYLQGSRYAERLEESHKARVQAAREAYMTSNNRSAHSSNPGSLSTSSSSANLPKLVPSHRGMMHDLVERLPAPLLEEPAVPPLPTRWSETDRHKALDIRLGGLEAAYTGTNLLKPGSQNEEACAVRADQPMPRAAGIYYWECSVQAKNKEVWIGIGFCSSKTTLERLPGWESESWAYHGDDGHIFSSHSTGKPYGSTQHKYGPTDTVGCGVNFRTGQAFFTKNGNNLGVAFNNIKVEKLYPVVGMKKIGECVRVNFGQKPFVFDIDAHVRRERERVQGDVLKSSISSLNPALDENTLVQRLVAQYLSLDGYIDTARAFAAEIGKEAQSLAKGHGEVGQTAIDHEVDQSLEAVKRQRIRAAVLRGDIDAAFKLVKLHFERVLKENENIYFKLRCRKYVEMIRRVDEQKQQPFLPRSPGKDALQSMLPQPSFGEEFNDVFGHGMELDDQLQLSLSNSNKKGGVVEGSVQSQGGQPATANQLHGSNGNGLDLVSSGVPVTEEEVIRYGTQLQLDFKDDPRREVKKTLEDTLALIAYENPRDSPLAHLLDESARAPVAEELNAAILVSLGKSASSGLEVLVQQVEVLVDDLAEDGGVGTMINVRGDYLR